MASMTAKIDKAVSALKELPQEQQEVAASAILDYAASADRAQLTDEQVAEIERRLSDPKPKFLALQDAIARLKMLGA